LLVALPSRGVEQLFSQPPPGGRYQLPQLVLPEANMDDSLPAITLPKTLDSDGLMGGERLYVHDYRFRGEQSLTKAELDALIAPYRRREVTYAELMALRDAITLSYVARGYINSGAVIPEQTIIDGIVEIELVAGRLGKVDYHTDGRLHKSYVEDRLRPYTDTPLNALRVETYLQLLQQDDRIDRIDAALIPTNERGTSDLQLHLTERPPLRIAVQLDNYASPSVGAQTGRFHVTHTNPSGFGDRLEAGYQRSQGMWSIDGRYEWPVNAGDTLLAVHGERSKSQVVEKRFRELDIESESASYGFTLRQPVSRTGVSSSSVLATTEWRRSKAFLLGEPFSFSPGVEDGEAKVAVVRLAYERFERSRRDALQFRSQLSMGLDALDATKHTGNTPDGQFTALLLQGQWTRRLAAANSRLLARLETQMSNSPLLGMEQFALGGHATVRGYRENTLVRDRGWAAALELRFPIAVSSPQYGGLEWGVFVDAGRAWNALVSSGGPDQLASAGIGVHWSSANGLSTQLEWAARLRDVPSREKTDVQDEGLQWRISAAF
jgi:hemolysin activation/secretion protein